MKKQILILTAVLVFLQLIYLASALTIKDISISPSTVEPGKKVSVSITLENNFNDVVENVQVSLDLSKVPISPEASSTVFVEKIKEDKSDSFDFGLTINSDAEAGVYKFPVLISYNLNNKTVQEDAVISVTVNAKPKLDVNSEGFLLIGKNKLNVKITNSGLAKARFLEVNAGTGNYNLLSSGRVYIGDLNSDDFDTISYDLYVKNPGTLTIPLEIIYKDFANNDYQEDMQVSVRVYSQQEALNLGLIQKSNLSVYIGLIIVVIILWIIYSRLKKWLRNRKKNNGR